MVKINSLAELAQAIEAGEEIQYSNGMATGALSQDLAFHKVIKAIELGRIRIKPSLKTIDMTPFIENSLDCIFTNPTEFVSDRDFIGPLRNMGNDSAVGRFYDDHTGRHFKCCRPRLNHPFLWTPNIELPEGLVVEYCWDRTINRKPIWRDHNPFGSRSNFLVVARIIDKKDGYVWAGGE